MRRRLAIGAAILAITLLNYFQFPGHSWLQSDTQIYLPILEHIWDPDVLAKPAPITIANAMVRIFLCMFPP